MARGLYDFVWKPKSIEESVDAGVHPAVAAMRLGAKSTAMGSGLIVGGMDLKATPWAKKESDMPTGYTYNKRNGPAMLSDKTHPVAQLERLQGQGVDAQVFLRKAKEAGFNPADELLNRSAGPGLPGLTEKEKKKKKKKSKDKKKKKKKGKDKKKDKKKKASKKKKKKDSSSSSSGSSSSDGSSSSSSSSKSSKKKKKSAKGDKKEEKKEDKKAEQKKAKKKKKDSDDSSSSDGSEAGLSEGEKKRRRIEAEKFLNELDKKPMAPLQGLAGDF
eukprot:TRINITY_DN121817_c0_g1_i1.p1 TRINITY_DN121817_c0_g1~~TRINITY_DN121817_c0_g1_i1.p1  ORF type:complete len:273 (-),score=121.43 TRINITY_DN121817_c0_g1_i1:98-916(-)